jgi:hypothetical protein
MSSGDSQLALDHDILRTGRPHAHVSRISRRSVQRTPAEIQSTMDTVAVGNEPGLVSLWHLSDGAGTVAHDSSASANNGALSGYDDGGLPQWVPSNAPIF